MGGWGGRGGIIIRTFREHARPFCLIFDCNHERNTLSKEGPRTRKNGIVFSENKTFYLGRRKKMKHQEISQQSTPPSYYCSIGHTRIGRMGDFLVCLSIYCIQEFRMWTHVALIIEYWDHAPPMKEKKKKTDRCDQFPSFSPSIKKKFFFQTFYFPVPSLIIWKYQGYKLIQTLWHAPPVARFSVVPLGNASPVRKSEGGGETSAAVAKL